MIRERVPILLLALALTALPQAAAQECTTAASPYFFVLFDTSSATNWSADLLFHERGRGRLGHQYLRGLGAQ